MTLRRDVQETQRQANSRGIINSDRYPTTALSKKPLDLGRRCHQFSDSDLHVVALRSDQMSGSHLCNSLVRELNILLKCDSILNLPENDRKSNEQTASEEAPVGCEHIHVGDLHVVQAPSDGTTSRLDTFVETSKVRKLAAVVGQSTHEPVDARLPGSIGESVEHVEYKGTSVSMIGPVLRGVIRLPLSHESTVVSLLELVSAAPYYHDQGEKRAPGSLGTGGPSHALEVQRKAEDVRTNNLHGVVDHRVESARTSVEVGTVDLGEVVGVEPVGGKEHGEQKNDIWIGEKCLP